MNCRRCDVTSSSFGAGPSKIAHQAGFFSISNTHWRASETLPPGTPWKNFRIKLPIVRRAADRVFRGESDRSDHNRPVSKRGPQLRVVEHLQCVRGEWPRYCRPSSLSPRVPRFAWISSAVSPGMPFFAPAKLVSNGHRAQRTARDAKSLAKAITKASPHGDAG